MDSPIDVRPGLQLRLMTLEFAPELFALTVRNREYLARWLNWAPYVRELNDTATFIEARIQQYEAGLGPQFCIFYGDALVGVIGYHLVDKSNHVAEIGYWLAEDAQGKGIMSDSLKALIPYTFEALKMNRLQIRVATENHRSRAIPERLGFFREGVAREAGFNAGHYDDLVIYSLLKREWAKGQ